jgi:conjugal transfer/entry exclusion protein
MSFATSVARVSVGAALFAASALPLAAHAGPFADIRNCSDAALGTVGQSLTAVETQINSASFLGNRATTDKSNLLAKLEFAYSKAVAGKWGDAIQKLADISDTATALANAAKPKLDDASGINRAVINATQCMTGL